MNEQEIFDTVVKHLAKQGGKAAIFKEGPNGEYENCVYRGPNGTKCAVGVLLNDDEYLPFMEGLGVGALDYGGVLPERLKPFEHLMEHLQGAHDASTTGRSLRRALINIADDFELDRSALDDATFPEKWEAVGR